MDYARGQQPGTELCMQQYYHLFTSYRRPGLKKDLLITQSSPGAEKAPEAGHVIVACNNQVIFIIIIIISSRVVHKTGHINTITTLLWACPKPQLIHYRS